MQSNPNPSFGNGDENAFLCDATELAHREQGQNIRIVGPEEKQLIEFERGVVLLRFGINP